MKKRQVYLAFLLACFSFFSLFAMGFISAGVLNVTEEHPFLVNGEWIPAKELKVGDELSLINGSKVKIKNIVSFEALENESFPVYNLEAGEYHDFVVDDGSGEEAGVIVHNSEPIIHRSTEIITEKGNIALVFGEGTPPAKFLKFISIKTRGIVDAPNLGGGADSLSLFMKAVRDKAGVSLDKTLIYIDSSNSKKISLLNWRTIYHELRHAVFGASELSARAGAIFDITRRKKIFLLDTVDPIRPNLIQVAGTLPFQLVHSTESIFLIPVYSREYGKLNGYFLKNGIADTSNFKYLGYIELVEGGSIIIYAIFGEGPAQDSSN